MERQDLGPPRGETGRRPEPGFPGEVRFGWGSGGHKLVYGLPIHSPDWKASSRSLFEVPGSYLQPCVDLMSVLLIPSTGLLPIACASRISY